MVLKEKIAEQRKRAGLSQEQLAELLGVTRQSVSKWELGDAVPEIEKVLQMSSLFAVPTDYLLKGITPQGYTLSQAQVPIQYPVPWKKLGGAALFGISLLGVLTLWVLSAVFPHDVTQELASGAVRFYSGFLGFVIGNKLEMMLLLLLVIGAAGLGILFEGRLRCGMAWCKAKLGAICKIISKLYLC